MKLAILSLLCGSAAAFAPSASTSGSAVVAKAAMDDLEAIAVKSNPILKVSTRVFVYRCAAIYDKRFDVGFYIDSYPRRISLS